MKRCRKCGQTKSYSSFGKNRDAKDGHQGWCKECRKMHYQANRDKVLAYHKAYNVANREMISAKNRVYRKANADSLWAAGLRRRHGMRPWEWQAMWDEQNGACYLCRRPLSEDRGQVLIDHDHGCCPTNSSCANCRRGMACHQCNTAIGLLDDNPELMRMVADNLERRQAIVRPLIGTRHAEMLF